MSLRCPGLAGVGLGGMEKQMTNRFSSSVSRLGRLFAREDGNVAILFAAASVPLIALGGGVVDYSNARLQQRSLQDALDAAALAGVIGDKTDEEEVAVAEAYFLANHTDNAEVESVTFSHTGERLVGSATATVNTRFLRVIDIPQLDVSVSSTATQEMLNEPACVMAMNPTRKHTLYLVDTVSVIGADCNFYGNSSNPDDVVDPRNAENYLTGRSVQAVGYGHHYLENVTPPLEHAPEVLSDPLASMVIPAAGSCLFTGKQISGGTETLNPGTYCDGLEIKSGANVTLNPGTYIIDGDKFRVESSTVTGDDVTIVLTGGNHAVLYWKQSTIRLSGQRTGSEAGFVIMGERVNSTHIIDKSTVDLEGVVYLPDGAFDWANTGTPTINTKWTAWIVDGFEWSGDGTISMPFSPDESDVPYPEELGDMVPRPGTPRLIS
jgi:Flp pilus assembly protein TadG